MMPDSTLERLLRVKELAEVTGWSDQRIYRLVNHPDPTRRIPHMRLGREVHFRLSDVQAWLEQHRVAIAAPAVPVRRPSKLTHAEECARLGIEPDHQFSSY